MELRHIPPDEPRVAAAPAERGGPTTATPELTIAVMTAGAVHLPALLDLFRPLGAELLVALDDRADTATLAALDGIADRIVLYPYAEPVDRPLPWLFETARGDWLLILDDDEIPSCDLLAELGSVVRDATLTHCWIPRRWLFPTTATALDEPPWRPDYQLRLVRRDPRFIRFSDEFHRPIVADGPGRFLATPVWHADPVLRSHEERLEKARRYERMRPGMRIAGRALNFAFYVPELRPGARSVPVPPDDRAMIDRVLRAEDVARGAPSSVTRVGRDEIDALWPGDVPHDAYGARLDLLHEPTTMHVDEQQTLDVRVENRGRRRWEWGETAPIEIRLVARWYDLSGREDDAPALRTPFPAPIEPGAWDIVPVHVVAPARPGRYRVEIDLVHEHVRWFDCGISAEVDVVPVRRVAIIGRPAPVLAAFESAPELEPVLVQPGAALPSTGDDFEYAPGLRSYLLDAAPARGIPLALTAARRTVSLLRIARSAQSGRPLRTLPRGGTDFLESLARCERLVITSLDGEPHRRELARLWVSVRAARLLGVPVALAADALPTRSRVAAAIAREADLVYDDPTALVASQ